MENFGKTRKANFPYDNSLNNFSLNRLQLNGTASGYDIKESNVKTFSRNIHNDSRNERNRKLVTNSGKANDTYIFSANKGTVETKRSKVNNSNPIDDTDENQEVISTKKAELSREKSTRVVNRNSVTDNLQQNRINQQNEESKNEDFEISNPQFKYSNNLNRLSA
jgi:hypothetical protein